MILRKNQIPCAAINFTCIICIAILEIGSVDSASEELILQFKLCFVFSNVVPHMNERTPYIYMHKNKLFRF